MKLGGFPVRIWRNRGPRAIALGVALLLLATLVPPGPRLAQPGPGEALLVYTPVPLDAGDPGRRDVGRLHFLGGWSLTSPDERLGGLSGIHVENGEAIAVSAYIDLNSWTSREFLKRVLPDQYIEASK